MWRGGQNKKPPGSGIVRNRAAKNGRTYPFKYFPCSFAFILPIQFDVSYLSNYILIL